MGRLHTCGLDLSAVPRCWGSAQKFRRQGGYAFGAVPIGGDTTAAALAVSAGEGVSCVIDPAHTAWCWGADWWGATGTGQETSSPLRVMGDREWSAIDAGDGYACGRTTTDEIYCWGGDRYATTVGPVFVDLPKMEGFAVGGFGWACGLAAGDLLCWGPNWAGPPRPGPAQAWARLAAGPRGLCVSTPSGTAWCALAGGTTG